MCTPDSPDPEPKDPPPEPPPAPKPNAKEVKRNKKTKLTADKNEKGVGKRSLRIDMKLNQPDESQSGLNVPG